MSDWSPEWDLSTIPDDVFMSERGRRNVSKRKVCKAPGGSKPTLVSCLGCREVTSLTKFKRLHWFKCPALRVRDIHAVANSNVA